MGDKNREQCITVKEYAGLIGKSDKTVYKMIKDGLIRVNKEEKKYRVVVDTFLHKRFKDMNRNLLQMQEVVLNLEKRLAKLEEKSISKKSTTDKLIKPLKKSMKRMDTSHGSKK